MAISTEQGILAMLKVYYAKEGLQNLLFRNDPFLKIVKKNRVEGKQQNFSAMYTRGGAVSANFLTAKTLATSTAQAKEFEVTPGQLFSACVFNNKELLASKTQRGAYLPVASAKMFANAESFRKTLAVAVYGSGHGEIYTASAAMGFTVAEKEYTLPTSAIMGIDIGSKLDVFAVSSGAVDYTTVKCKLTVTAINMATKKIKATSSAAYDGAEGDVICISGCSDDSGNPLLPVGIAGWLPATAPSANERFFNVDRSVAPDRLAGNRIVRGNTETKIDAIKNAILQVSRYGSKADIIVMNDEDRLALANEIENKTYFTKVDGGKGKGKAEVGYSDFGFSVDKNFLDNVIGSPYCPKGTAYVLDSEVVELWTYSNADKINDGAADPYKPEVSGETDVQDKPYQLLVDDLFSIQPGVDTAEGPAALVSINFYGEFVVTNPSMCAVITF